MEYAGDTRTGLIRAVNQDSILALSKGEVSLFVVADGMGDMLRGRKQVELLQKIYAYGGEI